MKIVIAGGTGLVGARLTNYLLEKGHEIFILTRSAEHSSDQAKLHYVPWLEPDSKPEAVLDEVDAVINLAGQSINSRWTSEQKKKIVDSRIFTTRSIIQLMQQMEKKPAVFINASAIGIYGTSETKVFTEETNKFGNDFLAKTVQLWETEASKAREMGIRTVFARFGLILDKKGGALPRMVLPYKWFVGGTVGSGKQWLSWIHIFDVLQALELVLTTATVEGPVNFVSSRPVQMKEFGAIIGKVLSRPHFFPAPSFALKLLLGEMSMLVLEGQRVMPSALGKAGYSFAFNELETALMDILTK